MNEDDLIPIPNADFSDDELFPTGTQLIPTSYMENGVEKMCWVAVTPDMLDPEKFEKEKARLLDKVIDENIKKEMQ